MKCLDEPHACRPCGQKHRRSMAAAAAERGDAECVKLLIPAPDPKADGSLALRSAARRGKTEY